MKKCIALIVLVLILSATGFAQNGEISGTLTFEDGSPVTYATVFIQSIQKHTLSDEKGKYKIIEVPYGTYQVEISSIEIQPVTYTIQVNSSTVSQSFQLKMAEADVMEEILVEGKSVKRVMEETGFAVNVVETKQASLQSLQTNDLLNRAVGVRVRQNGGMGAAVDYNLNGMSGNSVRIFIDGIPASTYGSSFSLNSIPPALIERIEVYKGVIPAHLTDDALGGAINVVLKEGMRNSFTVSTSYGSFNTSQSNFSGSFRTKSGFTVRASGFYNYSDNDYEIWGKFARNISPSGRYEYVKARRFNDAYESIGGRVEIGFTDVKWADQFLIGYNGSDDYNEVQHGRYMTIPYKGRYTESQANVFSLNYRKSDFLTKNLEFTFNGMHSQRNELVNDTVRWNYNWYGEKSIGLKGTPILTTRGAQQGAPTLNYIDRNVTTFRAGLNYDINSNHRIVLSHMFYTIDRREQDKMRSKVEREFVETRDLLKNTSALAYELKAFEDRLSANVFGKYYQQQIERMDPTLRVVNGETVRVEDRANSHKSTMGYGMALSIAIKKNFTLLTSAERAVRMPVEGEIFGNAAENIVENFELRPEISDNLNLGFRAGAYKWKDHKVNIYVSGFLRDTKDKITQKINERMNDAVQTDPYENLGKTKSIGFEAELNYSFDNNLTVLLSASKFNSVFNDRYDSHGSQYRRYNQQLPNEPFFTISASAQYDFHDLIQDNSIVNLNYNFGFVEQFYTIWETTAHFRTPRQHIHDIGVSYTFPNQKFVVSADARNIFNKQAYDNFGVQKPGRAFYLKINYTINNF